MEPSTARDLTCCRWGMAVAACLWLCILLLLTPLGSAGRAAPGSISSAGLSGGRLFWPEDGVPLCTAYKNQQRPAIVSDGAGGAIVAWEDYRHATSPYGPTDIYAQRVASDGVPAWTLDGIAVSVAPDNQGWIQMTSDGEGGVIMAWDDWRSGYENSDIYAQRVSAAGEALWATDGLPVSAAAHGQDLPAVAGDGAGGAIVAWEDGRSGEFDIYAQRVHADGTMVWAVDGIPLSAAAGDQYWAEATADDAGGAIVAWQGGCGDGPGICVQRVNADGTLAWPADGRRLSQRAGDRPELTRDGEGGAIVAWQSGDMGSRDIYAQRVYSDGTVAWTENGVAVCLAPGDQINPVLVGDGAGGAIVAWQDERNGDEPLVYAQHVYSDGTIGWTGDGIRVATGGGVWQWSPDITSDGEGGAILTWRGAQTVDHIYAQRLRGDGALLWGADSLLVCGVEGTFGGGQDLPHLVANGAGGAIVVWEDNREWYKEDELDIYVQRVGEGPRTYLPLVARNDGGR